MKKKKITKQEEIMSLSKQIASSLIVLAIVFGLIGYYKIGLGTTKASQPPGGGGTQEIYVNNVKGNDVTGDGSISKPYASPEKGFKIANGSFADLVKVWIVSTGKPYKLATDLGFKRNNLEVAGYYGRPMLIGATEGWRLYEFTIDDTWGNKIVGMDTRNYRVRVNQGHQLTIEKMSFWIDDMSRLDKPFVWLSGDHDGSTPEGAYVNNDVVITKNTFTAVTSTTGSHPLLVGIHAESMRDSQITLNAFKSSNWDTAIKIIDATGVQAGANAVPVRSGSPIPLYLFDKANVSQVYSDWS